MSDDIRVPRSLLIDFYRLIQGRAGRGNEEAIRAVNDIDALLAAPPAAPRPGYVKCANPECANTFGGYGYGEWPKVCPDCQDKGIKPFPAAGEGEEMSEPSLHEMVKVVYDYVIEQRQKEEEELQAKIIRAQVRARYDEIRFKNLTKLDLLRNCF